MKILALIPVLMGAHSFAWADDNGHITNNCYNRATRATERFVEEGLYDKNGIASHHCELAPNKKAVICDVAANKGNGAATDAYLVVLSRDCRKVYRVELVGEE